MRCNDAPTRRLEGNVTRPRRAPRPCRQIKACALMASAIVGIGGCGSPPSAVPLMQVAERTMQREAQRVRQGIERDKQQLDERQQALAAAYRRDLENRDKLTVEWVLDATQGYVAAREALVKQQLERARTREQRARNLEAAAAAQQRARALLQRQDKLLTEVAGGKAWDLERLLLDDEQQ